MELCSQRNIQIFNCQSFKNCSKNTRLWMSPKILQMLWSMKNLIVLQQVLRKKSIKNRKHLQAEYKGCYSTGLFAR
jgi:hypothetical protein